MMEAVQTTETLLNSHQSTRRYNPEGSHLHTHRRENLKFYSKQVAPILTTLFKVLMMTSAEDT
jgi:hypothetical protein